MYEEFGAILLLVLTVTHRYGLAPSEIGITSSMSFVRQLLETEAAEQPLDDLDGSKWKHLGDWIAALFVADSLSDELTSSCSPLEFYKIVPTLLCQSIEACESGKMSIESLKTGFDCKLAYSTIWGPAMTKLLRPSGAFPPPIACCGPSMACQSFVENNQRGQSIVVSSTVTPEGTFLNRGRGDTSDDSLDDS